MNDWDNRDDDTPSTNPFDKAAAQQLHDDDYVEDLPTPSLTVQAEELDTKAELEHQKKLDQIIEAMKIRADDPLRDEKARQRKAFIDAENRLKAAVGSDSENNFMPPDPTAPVYSTPTAPARPTVVMARRFNPRKLKGSGGR